MFLSRVISGGGVWRSGGCGWNTGKKHTCPSIVSHKTKTTTTTQPRPASLKRQRPVLKAVLVPLQSQSPCLQKAIDLCIKAEKVKSFEMTQHKRSFSQFFPFFLPGVEAVSHCGTRTTAYHRPSSSGVGSHTHKDCHTHKGCHQFQLLQQWCYNRDGHTAHT